MLNAIQYSHFILDELIQHFPKGQFIDATLGNGHDSLYLMQHPDFKGSLLAFDIQEQALETSQAKINQINTTATNHQFILDSHANIEQYLENDAQIHGAIFNLGYLPKGDHSITTRADSTMEALEKMQRYLVKGGKIIVVVYPGHPEGQIEKERLLQKLPSWPQTFFQVLQYQLINQANNPPFVLVIERIKD
ncbi:tRNA (mnm(5)s(2)U34)-methyltransferase [Fundicoccus sp. Sow4_H7]|uniref:tRNA (mnm(5)s(2)U34)-methyltransferase n=1 Tax=Fundicoccus sp. Sow4_H7 TaxID=3438784 RepID=UPI003F8DC783